MTASNHSDIDDVVASRAAGPKVLPRCDSVFVPPDDIDWSNKALVDEMERRERELELLGGVDARSPGQESAATHMSDDSFFDFDKLEEDTGDTKVGAEKSAATKSEEKKRFLKKESAGKCGDNLSPRQP